MTASDSIDCRKHTEEEHARRVSELLASNNALLDRARNAERERDQIKKIADQAQLMAITLFERAEKGDRLLRERDEFIGARGLWQDFVDSLPPAPKTVERCPNTGDMFEVGP